MAACAVFWRAVSKAKKYCNEISPPHPGHQCRDNSRRMLRFQGDFRRGMYRKRRDAAGFWHGTHAGFRSPRVSAPGKTLANSTKATFIIFTFLPRFLLRMDPCIRCSLHHGCSTRAPRQAVSSDATVWATSPAPRAGGRTVEAGCDSLRVHATLYGSIHPRGMTP